MAWDYEQVFNLWNDIAHVLQANVYVPLTIIICDKLEWERKMEEQDIHIDMKALIFYWSLLIYVGLKVASKVIKEKYEQGINGWYEGSNIY